MSIPTYSAAQFLSGILRTMPRGKAWPRAAESVLSQVLSGYMPSASRFGEAAQGMVADVFPATTVSVLSEWEATLGLPDPCAGESATIALRQAQVVARFSDTGGSSIAYFTAFAKTLGYAITIQQFAPARAGIARAGDRCYGPDWAFAWRVLSPGYTPVYARASIARAGDKLMTWGNAVLQCEVGARAPAHTIVQFGQSGLNSIGDFGDDII